MCLQQCSRRGGSACFDWPPARILLLIHSGGCLGQPHSACPCHARTVQKSYAPMLSPACVLHAHISMSCCGLAPSPPPSNAAAAKATQGSAVVQDPRLLLHSSKAGHTECKLTAVAKSKPTGPAVAAVRLLERVCARARSSLARNIRACVGNTREHAHARTHATRHQFHRPNRLTCTASAELGWGHSGAAHARAARTHPRAHSRVIVELLFS